MRKLQKITSGFTKTIGKLERLIEANNREAEAYREEAASLMTTASAKEGEANAAKEFRDNLQKLIGGGSSG